MTRLVELRHKLLVPQLVRLDFVAHIESIVCESWYGGSRPQG